MQLRITDVVQGQQLLADIDSERTSLEFGKDHFANLHAVFRDTGVRTKHLKRAKPLRRGTIDFQMLDDQRADYNTVRGEGLAFAEHFERLESARILPPY